MNLESFVKSLRSKEMILESFVKSLLIKARRLRCWTVCFSNMCLQFVVLGSIAGFEVLVEVCPKSPFHVFQACIANNFQLTEIVTVFTPRM